MIPYRIYSNIGVVGYNASRAWNVGRSFVVQPCGAYVRLAERRVIAAAPQGDVADNTRCPCPCPFVAEAPLMVRVPHLRFRPDDIAIGCSQWYATPAQYECASVAGFQSTTSPCPDLLKTGASAQMLSQDVPAVKGERGILEILIPGRDVRMTSTAHLSVQCFYVTTCVMVSDSAARPYRG
jgi:hypothetical protein